MSGKIKTVFLDYLICISHIKYFPRLPHLHAAHSTGQRVGGRTAIRPSRQDRRSRSSRRWYIPAAVLSIYAYLSTKKLNKLAGKPRRSFPSYSLNIRQLQDFTTENHPANSHVFSRDLAGTHFCNTIIFSDLPKSQPANLFRFFGFCITFFKKSVIFAAL